MSVWPAWEVREAGGATSWFHVRLGFVDGARVELLAVVCGGRVSVEDVRAQPPLSLVDLTVLADWIEGPLFERCDQGGVLEAVGVEGAGDAVDATDGTGAADGTDAADAADVDDGYDGYGAEGAREPAVAGDADETFGPRRARQAWPRGIEGRWLVAQEYRAAQEEGGPRARGHVRDGTQSPQIAPADRAGA